MPKLNMKHLITFIQEKPNHGPEPGGEWKTVTKAWAAVRTFQGTEIMKAGVDTPVENLRFIMRYQPGITSDMRIEHKGRTYLIENVMNDDEADKTLTIVAHTMERP